MPSIRAAALFFLPDLAPDEVVYVDNEPHLTRRTIGEWLGYGNPKAAISKTVRRYPFIRQRSRRQVSVA